jgi:hypothetical protein
MNLLLQTSPDDPTKWILIAIGGLALAYVLLRPRLKKRDPLADTGPRFSLAQQRATEQSMQNLLVELADMSRQITAQLDTRSARLEALIEDADRKIEELRRAQRSPAATAPLEKDGALTPTQIEAAPIDPRHAEIYALSDGGKSVHDIAQQLDRPRGEIELILALRPGKH